jgi:uncharacterized coiled-coil DUF342 family protein
MRFSPLALAATLALVFASTVEAQADRQRSRDDVRQRRTELRERLRNMTPEQRQAFRDKTAERREQMQQRRQERFEQLDPAMQEWIRSLQAQRGELRGQVQAGTLDRRSAAEQLKAWRESNPRPTPPPAARPGA